MRRRLTCELGWLGGLLVTLLSLPAGAGDPTTPVRDKLDERVQLTFSDHSFEEVLGHLAETLQLQIHPSWRRLDESGFARDTKVTINLKEVKAAIALELLLDQVGGGSLDYYVRDNLLVVTTIDDAASAWRPRVFFVKDLVEESLSSGLGMGMPMMGGPGMMGAEADAGAPMGMGQAGMPGAGMTGYPGQQPGGKGPRDGLLDFITAAVAPTSWDEAGGHGTIEYYRGFIVVKHSHRVQQEVADLLDAMREARGPQQPAATERLPQFPGDQAQPGTDELPDGRSGARR